jgi:hypothetical protein
MYRWLITHDGGMSALTPPRLWRVWVGMPTIGREAPRNDEDTSDYSGSGTKAAIAT